KNNITIYSSHTPLDKARGGLNDLMAKRLNLQNCKVLSPDGFGVVGTLKTVGTLKGNSGEKAGKGMNGEEFIKFVKKQFGLKYLRCSKPIGYSIATDGRIAAAAGKITKVAVSSGSGQGSAKDAIAAGAQVLVTADVSHHNFYQPEGFMILDIGHYESEWEAVALLESIVKKNFSKFAVSLSKRDKSPIYHF
ncbi:MAG: Nif3-like dinuclear metal center hexameric protein, partial [Bacteroidales bacterium]